MPFVPATPEAHISLTTTSSHTCAGVTNLGTQCNRSLPANHSPSNPPATGVITTIGNRSLYFCPKHQDQASNIVLRHTASFAHRRALVGRGSLDTLIEQVEVLVGPEVTPGGGRHGNTVRTKVTSETKKVGRADDPFALHHKEDDDDMGLDGTQQQRPPTPPIRYDHPTKPRKKKNLLLRILLGCCCSCLSSSSDSDDDANARKHQNEKNWSERTREAELRQAAAGVVGNSYNQTAPGKKADGKKKTVRMETVPPAPTMPMMVPKGPDDLKGVLKKGDGKGKRAQPVGQTPVTVLSDEEEESESETDKIDTSKLTKEEQRLISLIPPSLPRKAAAKLRTELLRPFSDKDEPGYIYIFWLTDSPLSPFATPSPSPAPSPGAHKNTNILSSTSGGRRLSAYLDPSNNPSGSPRPKLLFKIGRAVNVQRRLHQWSTQCGYNLSLIRYYPHTSATSPAPKLSPGASSSYLSATPTGVASPDLSPGGSPLGRKVPNVNRVERLIHLELGAMPGANPVVTCDGCGKQHKEWFELDASREGVLGVDAVVKKWIAYAEGGPKEAQRVMAANAAIHAAAASNQHYQVKRVGSIKRPQPPKRQQANVNGVVKEKKVFAPPKAASPLATGSGVKMYDRKKLNASYVPPGASEKDSDEDYVASDDDENATPTKKKQSTRPARSPRNNNKQPAKSHTSTPTKQAKKPVNNGNMDTPKKRTPNKVQKRQPRKGNNGDYEYSVDGSGENGRWEEADYDDEWWDEDFDPRKMRN
ncbi:DUF1766-domain-containing protein [Ascodesmis nigricans]|uniref:DUF1766-domain-containing protein n=1 Tax=Ascodesmis nigricans TaxID=341454 RepID=A0A4S2N5D6_9PEZI|nr:DUF1766-domain-containing protein [Ascodesmis nigricans]